MGEAKRRRELGLPGQTIRLPALTQQEVQLIHNLMHRRLHELGHHHHGEGEGGEGMDEASHQEFHALQELHSKLFQH